MTPNCQNCGSHVTPQFVSVFALDEADADQWWCPRCPDRVCGGARGRPDKRFKRGRKR